MTRRELRDSINAELARTRADLIAADRQVGAGDVAAIERAAQLRATELELLGMQRDMVHSG